jgi:hypothetical protein
MVVWKVHAWHIDRSQTSGRARRENVRVKDRVVLNYNAVVGCARAGVITLVGVVEHLILATSEGITEEVADVDEIAPVLVLGHILKADRGVRRRSSDRSP